MKRKGAALAALCLLISLACWMVVRAKTAVKEPVPALVYHHVAAGGEECNEMTVTAGRLEEDLRWLAENGYETVLPRELAAEGSLPEKPVLVTFDDGYRSNYTLSPFAEVPGKGGDLRHHLHARLLGGQVPHLGYVPGDDGLGPGGNRLPYAQAPQPG